MNQYLWIALSCFFFILSLIYFSRSYAKLRKIAAPFLAILTVLWILLLFAYMVANWFTGVGFDESVFYHLNIGLDGAGFGDFTGLIITGVLLVISALCLAGFVWRMMVKGTVYLEAGRRTGFGMVFLLIALLINPALLNLYQYVQQTTYQNDFFSYYVVPTTDQPVTTPVAKNILYIYLESLERTYFDETLFPGLLPNLSALEQQAVSFTDIDQVIGSNWTIAGMVASQCSLPLLSLFSNDNFTMDSFLPEARCFGDVLQEHGYQLEFIGGANNQFAGKGLFYQNHGFARVSGKEELLAQLSDKAYTHAWGLYDDTLLDIVYDRVTELGQQEQPFGLFTINLGTHHPDGQIARSCGEIKYQDGKDPLLNAVHCTDRLLAQFVQRIQALPIAKDTLIVLGSDHLAMPNNKSNDRLNRGQRRDTLMVLNPQLAPAQINKRGTTLDIAPTLLGYLGMKTPAFGLGRDLLGQETTLLEQYGSVEAFNQRILSWRPLIELFWGYPTLGERVLLKKTTNQIEIGGRSINFPVLLAFNQQRKVTAIWYNMHRSQSITPANYLTGEATNHQDFLWVDSCAQIHTLAAEVPKQLEAICYYLGSLASKQPRVGQLSEEQAWVSLATDEQPEILLSEANRRRTMLLNNNLADWEELSHQVAGLSRIQMIAQFGAAGSHAINRPSFFEGKDVASEGLTLVKIGIAQDVNKGIESINRVITTVPLCSAEGGEADLAALVQVSLKQENERTLLYVLLGNAEAACSQYPLMIPKNSGLRKLDSIKPGQPYMAVLDSQLKVIYERSARQDKTISLTVDIN